MLTRAEDGLGSSFEVEWSQFGNIPVPTEIQYGGNANGIEHFYHVFFSYGLRLDRPVSFRFGVAQTLQVRLVAVNVTTDIPERANIRGYLFHYDEQTIFDSQLVAVEATGKPTQLFAYSPGFASHQSAAAAVSIAAPPPFADLRRWNASGEVMRSIIDINGDGLLDLVKGDRFPWTVHFGHGDGTEAFGFDPVATVWSGPATSLGQIRNVWVATGPCDNNGWACAVADTFDINGDGFADYVEASSNNQPWRVYRGGVQPGGGWGFAPTPQSWPAPDRFIRRVKNGRTYRDVIDINGDGLVDFVDVAAGVWSVHLNNGVGFDADPLPFFPAPVDSISRQTGGNETLHMLADFNGDGLADLLRHVDAFADPLCEDFPWDPVGQQYTAVYDCLLVYFNDGQGFAAEPRIIALPLAADGISAQDNGGTINDLVDLNGDGLPDWVEVGPTGDDWLVLLNTGGDLEPVSFAAAPPHDAIATRVWSGGGGPIRDNSDQRTSVDLVDLNGDGFLDHVSASGATWQVRLSERRERPGSLTMMENGLGGTNTIVYAPSTRFEHLGGDGVSDLPFVTWVVAGTRLNDGLCTPPPGADVFSPAENPCIEAGHEILSFFRYEDGRLAVEYELDGAGNPLAVAHREFRGFRSVTRSDVDGNDSLTVFAQDSIAKGQPLLVARLAGALGEGHLVRWEANSWATRPLGAGRDQLWLQQNTRVTADLGAEIHVVTTRNDDVDGFGNVLHSWTEGTALPRVESFTEYAVPIGSDGFFPRDKPRRSSTRDVGGVLEDRRFHYDNLAFGAVGAGNLTKVEAWLDTSASWIATENNYDTFGNIVAVRAANGATTTTSYDDGTGAFLYPIRVANPLGQETVTLFDYRFASPALTWGANGIETLIGYAYDAAGRLTCEVRPGDSFADCTIATTYAFATQAGELSSVTVDRKQSGQATPLRAATYFDALGRQRHVESRQVVNGVLQTVRRDEVEFDAGGRVARRLYPYVLGSASGSGSTSFDYHLNGSEFIDPLGRLHRTTHSDGTVTRVEYAGPKSLSYDEAGEKTVRHVDALGRVVREEIFSGSALYSSSSSVFDGLGRLVELYENDAATPLKTITYDTLGRKIVMLDRDSGAWSYGYDAVGNLLYQDDPKTDQHVQYCYDLLSRPLRRCALQEDFHTTYSCAQVCDDAESRWEYDDPTVPFSIGRLTRVSDAAGALRILAYDARGRQITVERDVAVDAAIATARFEYAYNDADEIASIVYPDGEVVTTTYDASGQPVRLFNAAGTDYVSNVLYDAFGRATWIAHGNGASDSRSYADAGQRHRLATLSTVADGALPLTLLYQYDARGQIRGIIDLDLSAKTNAATYQYDRLGRLTSFDSYQDAADRSYAYDAWGNITRKGPLVFAYGDPYAAHVAPHQLTGVAGQSIGHDANGNRTNGLGGQTYTYNGEDRLARVDLSGGRSTRFLYDHEGQLRARIAAAGGAPRVTRYFNDLVHTTADGQTLKFYFLGGVRIAARHTQDSAWQTAGLLSRPIQVAATWIGRPAVVLQLSASAQRWGAGGVALLLVGLLLLPGRRRRPAVVGVRLRAGPVVGTALLFLLGATPWPWMVRPADAACGEPTPSPAQRIDHFHTDHLRSTLLVTDAAGAIVEHIRYYPYGEVRGRWNAQGDPIGAPPADEVRYEYTGYESEPSSGLRYAGARFYDASLASFLTPDPAGEFANPYAYAGWDPVNSSDPTGACELLCGLLVAFAVGFVIGAIEAAISGASFVDVLKAAVLSGAYAAASNGLAGPAGGVLGKLGGWGKGVSQALRVAAGGVQLYSTVEAFRHGEYLAGARGVLGILAAAYGGLAQSQDGIGAKPSEMAGIQYLNPSDELPDVAQVSYRPSKLLEPFPSAPVSGTRATVDAASITILGLKIEVGAAYAIDSAGTRRVFDIFSIGFETEILQISTARGLQITNAASVADLSGASTTIGGVGNPSFADIGAEITVTPRYRGYTVYFGAAYGILPVGAYGLKENWTPRLE